MSAAAETNSVPPWEGAIAPGDWRALVDRGALSTEFSAYVAEQVEKTGLDVTGVQCDFERGRKHVVWNSKTDALRDENHNLIESFEAYIRELTGRHDVTYVFVDIGRQKITWHAPTEVGSVKY